MAKSKSKNKGGNNASGSNKSALQRTMNQQQAAGKKSQAKQQSGGKKERTGFFGYFKGVRQEFKKVVWPTRDELVSDTIVVIAVCAFFALAFWLLDTGFLATLKGVLGITLS